MSAYHLTWITDHLAVGHAPMSYDDLDAIRDQGIDAIVNLCGEFCDLHDLEAGRGFEVYYLPIADECAPDMGEMEEGLAWLDEAIYLGKKVLIHCRFGIGRTGTFLTSYMIRRGLGLKLASRRLKKVRAKPSNWRQWRVLKKYNKKSGTLKAREPSLAHRQGVDLSPFFKAYERLVNRIDTGRGGGDEISPCCGRERDDCCFAYFELGLMEAVYLFNAFNRILTREAREAAIYRAVAAIKQLACPLPESPLESSARVPVGEDQGGYPCPLNVGGQCLVFSHRPLRCRLDGMTPPQALAEDMARRLDALSQDVFTAFSDGGGNLGALTFTVAETVSGRFVQKYFDHLTEIDPGSRNGIR